MFSIFFSSVEYVIDKELNDAELEKWHRRIMRESEFLVGGNDYSNFCHEWVLEPIIELCYKKKRLIKF